MKGINKWRGSIQKTLNYKCQMHEGSGKSQLEHCRNNYCRQGPGRMPKLVDGNRRRNWIYAESQSSSSKVLVTREESNFIVNKSADTPSLREENIF